MTKENASKEDSNVWEYVFSNLEKYDEYGDEIEYTVNEKDIESKFYIKSEVNQEEKRITNTFQVPNETVDIEVTKIWEDDNNKAEKRPGSVTLQVKEGNEVIAEETVYEKDGWKHTFTVPKYDEKGDEVEYSIDEKPLNNIFYTEENKVVDNENRTITNKFEVPDEKTEVTVRKVWNDNNNESGKRPEKVTMVLRATTNRQELTLRRIIGFEGMTYEKEITAENAIDNNIWEYTFKELAV